MSNLQIFQSLTSLSMTSESQEPFFRLDDILIFMKRAVELANDADVIDILRLLSSLDHYSAQYKSEDSDEFDSATATLMEVEILLYLALEHFSRLFNILGLMNQMDRCRSVNVTQSNHFLYICLAPRDVLRNIKRRYKSDSPFDYFLILCNIIEGNRE